MFYLFFSTNIMWVWIGRGNYANVSCRQSRPTTLVLSRKEGSWISQKNLSFKCQASRKQASESHFPAACQVSCSKTILGRGTSWEHRGISLLPLYLTLKLLRVFSHTNFISPTSWPQQLLCTEVKQIT